MKNYVRKLRFALICMLVCSLAGCGFTASESEFDEQSVIRVSVILPHEDDSYWGIVRQGIDDHLSDAKEWNIDIRIEIPQLNYSIEQMTDLIRRQIAAKTDIIVVQGAQDQNFIRALNDAINAGIQVVCIDTDIEEGLPQHLYIGSDNVAAGRMMGERLAQLMHYRGSVSIISGSAGYSNLEERLSGLESVISQHEGMELNQIVYDNYDALTAVDAYQSLENGSGLACIEGTGARAIEKVISADHRKFSYNVGFDTADSIQEGTISGIIKQDEYQIGEKLVEQLIYYRMHKGLFEADQIYTRFQWVDADNYDEVIGGETAE